jgi:hypothetical protein
MVLNREPAASPGEAVVFAVIAGGAPERGVFGVEPDGGDGPEVLGAKSRR